MGQNLISGCHRCKKKVGHLRGKENLAILDFYKKHKECAKKDISNVITILDNNGTDQEWQDNYEYDELDEKYSDFVKNLTK